MRFCPECGRELSGSTYCPGCGRALGKDPDDREVTASHRLQEGDWQPLRARIDRPRLPLIAGVLTLVLALAGGAVAVVAFGGGNHHPTRSASSRATVAATHPTTSQPTTTAPPTTTTEQPPPTTGTTSTTTQPTPGAPTPGAPSSATTPLAAVSNYWADIQSHDFAGAYGYIAPGTLEKSKSQFIAEERGEHISDVQFRGALTSNDGETANVEVLTLVTHDATYGCRTWSGSYEVTDSEGHWLIERANLSPQRC